MARQQRSARSRASVHPKRDDTAPQQSQPPAAPDATPASRCARMCRMAGRPKASVLPLPVAAMPTRSRPLSAMGRHCAWMGDGCWKLRVACSSCADRPAVGGARQAVGWAAGLRNQAPGCLACCGANTEMPQQLQYGTTCNAHQLYGPNSACSSAPSCQASPPSLCART